MCLLHFALVPTLMPHNHADPDETEVIHLKVGRANNLNRRMDQWGKQCGSKEQIVRGWWPGGIVHDEASLMKGTIKAGEKGAWCHRLERLVHLELADLATNTPYLHAGFPGKGKAKATASGSGSTSGNGDGKDKDKGKKGKKDINRCPDCMYSSTPFGVDALTFTVNQVVRHTRRSSLS